MDWPQLHLQHKLYKLSVVSEAVTYQVAPNWTIALSLQQDFLELQQRMAAPLPYSLKVVSEHSTIRPPTARSTNPTPSSCCHPQHNSNSCPLTQPVTAGIPVSPNTQPADGRGHALTFIQGNVMQQPALVHPLGHMPLPWPVCLIWQCAL